MSKLLPRGLSGRQAGRALERAGVYLLASTASAAWTRARHQRHGPRGQRQSAEQRPGAGR